MKKTITLLLLPLLFIATSFAQTNCYTTHRQEGIAAYNQGRYSEAKKHFQYILSSCPDKPANNDIQSWINKCDAALTPTLSVSNSSLSFSSSGGTQSITITSNHSWKLSATNSQMFSVSYYGNTITVRCYENTGTSSRSGYFIVQTTDGGKSIRINVSQYAAQTSLSVSKTSISCSASGTTEYITVSSNTSWQIEHINSSMFSITRSGSTLTVKINSNSTSANRSDYFYVKTTDGQIARKISLSQAGRAAQSGSPTNTTSSYLRVDKDYVSTGSYGTTAYIVVSSNRPWKVVYPAGSMYSVTRSGNTLQVIIKQNTTTVSRSDYFLVQLSDGSKQIKISLYQSANTSARTTYSNSSYSTNHTYQSPYRKYVNTNGLFEVTWFGMGGGIGTGIGFSMSAFRMRLGPVELRPMDVSFNYDFIEDDLLYSYQPSLDFLIPVSSDWTTYFGIGPSCMLSMLSQTGYNWWFNVEAGAHYHWGYAASSDFYLRYDGTFTVGVTIQWSTQW